MLLAPRRKKGITRIGSLIWNLKADRDVQLVLFQA